MVNGGGGKVDGGGDSGRGGVISLNTKREISGAVNCRVPPG